MIPYLPMKYNIKAFRKEFGTEAACLTYIFRQKYPTAHTYYPLSERKAMVDAKGHHIHPLAGTIFEKSSTPLLVWFEAIYLFSIAKNGVSAMELQRHFGVTYKTAWRMGHKIRQLMKQDKGLLSGIVEVDETYFGKKGTHQTKFKNKSALLGMVERGGRVRAQTIPGRETHILLGKIRANISKKAHIMTDEFKVYAKLPGLGYKRSSVNHSKYQWRKGNAYTNTIEGFWGQLKRSIRGTYSFVSPQHLQKYVDEFAFRYNQRHSSEPCFRTLISHAAHR